MSVINKQVSKGVLVNNLHKVDSRKVIITLEKPCFYIICNYYFYYIYYYLTAFIFSIFNDHHFFICNKIKIL